MKTNWAKNVRRGLILEILRHGRIETTLAKARSVQGEVDKVINLQKVGSLNSRRQLVKILGREVKTDKDFSARKSGYSRIIRLGKRLSDAAEMAILELLGERKKEETLPVEGSKQPKKLK
jgi:large subunit ribosomal protein L17